VAEQVATNGQGSPGGRQGLGVPHLPREQTDFVVQPLGLGQISSTLFVELPDSVDATQCEAGRPGCPVLLAIAESELLDGLTPDRLTTV